MSLKNILAVEHTGKFYNLLIEKELRPKRGRMFPLNEEGPT